MLKSTLFLTMVIFLMIVPEPDAKDIAEISANFIVLDHHEVLVASDEQTESVEQKRP